MKRLLPLGPALALAISAAWSGTAAAQDVWGWSVIIPSVTGTDQLGMHLRDQVARQRSQDREIRRAAPSQRALMGDPREAAGPIDPAVIHYTPSKARRTANLARFVEKTRAVDPAGAKDLQNLFASGDIIDKIGAAAAPYGIRIDNVADAYALWRINAWQASRGRNDTPSRATNDAVRAQAARALSQSREFAGATDAQKQELAESLFVQAALIDGAVERAKGNPGQLRDIRTAVSKGASGMGLDLSTMELTEGGFVPISTGSVTAPEAGTTRAAAAVERPGRLSPLSTGIIVAAAGSVGVGGVLLLRRARG